MSRKGSFASIAGALVFVSIAGPALAAILTVDDDRVQQPSANYTTIQAAVDVAGPGDEIIVSPGLYEEQVVIKDQVTLTGRPVGTNRVRIRPTALPVSRPSVLSGNPITAGILIDSTSVSISGIDLDLSGNDVAGCMPLLAGIYYRNAAGVVEQVTVRGVRIAGAPQCESGVGLYVESGDFGSVFGLPAKTRAVVKIRESNFYDYQKVGVAANGPRTFVRIAGGESIGDGASTRSCAVRLSGGQGGQGAVPGYCGETAGERLTWKDGRRCPAVRGRSQQAEVQYGHRGADGSLHSRRQEPCGQSALRHPVDGGRRDPGDEGEGRKRCRGGDRSRRCGPRRRPERGPRGQDDQHARGGVHSGRREEQRQGPDPDQRAAARRRAAAGVRPNAAVHGAVGHALPDDVWRRG